MLGEWVKINGQRQALSEVNFGASMFYTPKRLRRNGVPRPWVLSKSMLMLFSTCSQLKLRLEW
jgi:hypothetical protein